MRSNARIKEYYTVDGENFFETMAEMNNFLEREKPERHKIESGCESEIDSDDEVGAMSD